MTVPLGRDLERYRFLVARTAQLRDDMLNSCSLRSLVAWLLKFR